jgi:hypothetical protein
MRKLSFLPALAGCYPVLFLYAHNREQVRLQDMWLPLLLALLIGIALFLLWRRVLRDADRAGLLVFVWAACFWSTSLLDKLVLRLGGVAPGEQHYLLLGFVFLLLMLSTLLILRWRAVPRELYTALRVMTAVLLGFAVLTILPHEATRIFTAFRRARAHEDVHLAKTEMLPNIVHIVLDAYGRADILQTRYGLDNESFLRELEARDFHVFRAARADYNLTLLCLAAALNMEYVSGIRAAGDDTAPLEELVRNSRVRALLRERGYRMVAFESGWPFTDFRDADEFRATAAGWSPYHAGLLAMTPVPVALKAIGSNALDYFALQRQRVDNVFAHVPRVIDLDSPVFVFAHVLSPHPPFVFHGDGTPVQSDRAFSARDGNDFYDDGGTAEEYRARYPEQVRYVNRSVLDMIDRLKEHMTRPTIVILHGDHGPAMGLNWNDLPSSDLRERMAIFAAVSFPDGDYHGLADTITPVNLYRHIFSRYFGADLPPLPERSRVTNWQHLYTFTELDQATLDLDFNEHGPEYPPNQE